MAEIFKGKALDLHGIERPVVIKRILPNISASPEFVDMLIDEAKIAVMLSHGNIAQVYDLGKVGDDYFIVMEYVDGKTLSQIMKRLRTEGQLIPIAYAAAICAEVAQGLDHMHSKMDEQGNPLHIVHRDISPQNIILSTGGTIKIIDFGIAKAKTKVSTTDSGILKGKFAYMSPEHAEGERLDHRTDIFSLGVILHELLTGQRLFKGKNNAETIRKVKKARVPIPSEIRPEIPSMLDNIVKKALEKNRTQRYQSARDLAQDLTKFWIVHYPEFSPRKLIQFLHTLFPEMAPGEVRSSENTPLIPMVIRKEEKEDEHEDTMAADSEVIRSKLKEAEVFATDSSARLPSPPPKEEPEIEKEEKTDRFKMKKLIPKAAVFVGISLLLGLGLYGIHLYQARQSTLPQPLPQVSPLEEETLPLPPPPAPAPVINEHPASPTKVAPTRVAPPRGAPTGTLSIDSEPQGARIFLNDIDTNRSTPALLEQISSSRPAKIGLHLEHYKFWEGETKVEAGKKSSLKATLQINYGELEVNSLPEGADVYLNGQMVGKTPFHTQNIEPETTYTILIKQAGYEDWSRSIKIFGGKSEVVSASLKKLPEE